MNYGAFEIINVHPGNHTIYVSLVGYKDAAQRMNYDMHVGAVLGWPGKLLAFFASLVAASLPVTGFIIWWGRKKQSAGKQSAAIKTAMIA